MVRFRQGGNIYRGLLKLPVLYCLLKTKSLSENMITSKTVAQTARNDDDGPQT